MVTRPPGQRREQASPPPDAGRTAKNRTGRRGVWRISQTTSPCATQPDKTGADWQGERLYAPLAPPGRCPPSVRKHCYASTHGDTRRDKKETARRAAFPQQAGHFTRVWQVLWQVLGSNQRRLSRRFYSTLAPPEPPSADQRIRRSRRVCGHRRPLCVRGCRVSGSVR